VQVGAVGSVSLSGYALENTFPNVPAGHLVGNTT